MLDVPPWQLPPAPSMEPIGEESSEEDEPFLPSDDSRSNSRASSRDFSRNSSRDFSRNSRDFSRNDSRDFSRNNSRDFSRNDSRDFSRNSSWGDSRDNSRDNIWDSSRNNSRDFSQTDSRDNSQAKSWDDSRNNSRADLAVETNKSSAEDSDNEDQGPKETPEEALIKKAIRRRMQGYVDAYNEGDADKVSTFYAKDSFFIAPNRPYVRGPDGFVRCGITQHLMDMGAKHMKVKEGDITASSHLASVVAEFMLFDEDGDEFDDGRLVHVWVKVGDQWFLKHDIFN